MDARFQCIFRPLQSNRTGAINCHSTAEKIQRTFTRRDRSNLLVFSPGNPRYFIVLGSFLFAAMLSNDDNGEENVSTRHYLTGIGILFLFRFLFLSISKKTRGRGHAIPSDLLKLVAPYARAHTHTHPQSFFVFLCSVFLLYFKRSPRSPRLPLTQAIMWNPGTCPA